MDGKKIGDLNGRWALLFKLTQVGLLLIAPSIVGWGAWITTKIYAIEVEQAKITSWMAQGPRFTPSDAQALELRLKDTIMGVQHAELKEIQGQLGDIGLKISDLRTAIVLHTAKDQATKP